MSGGFELQPQDGGPRVALAPGETVIGRGPLLGITDKRVSRRHAILEVVGGQLRIKPIHANPCFYQSSEKSQLLPLKRNLWRWLNPGDSFSLLVDKYIFCVFSTHSETEMECTLRDPQEIEKEEQAVAEKAMTNEGFQGEQTAPASEFTTTQHKVADWSEGVQVPPVSIQQFPAEDWSTQPANEDCLQLPLLRPLNGDNNIIQKSGKEGICKDKTQVNVTQQGRKRLISSGSSESTSAEQDTGKKCKNAHQEESVTSYKAMPKSCSAISLSNVEVNDMKASIQRNEIPIEELGKVPEHKSIVKGTQSKEGEEMSCSESHLSAQDKYFHEESQGSPPESSSDLSNLETLHAKATDSVAQGSEENKIKRTSCMYGASCYRKNPVHFQHFSHPGDSDYGGVQVMCQDEADDRPECPYGASCYRKNPQHKIEYRHSALPVRSVSDEDSDNVGQPNEYDLNDSFLDDEEEEYEPTDEDSDWEPGQEDQEKEDVEELLQEAKKFMKRRK
nr:aprataxin and PNK-like factor [Mirounga angustirostris]